MRYIISQLAQQAIDAARRGDLQHAIRLAREALSKQPRDLGLMLFLGMLHSRRLELEEAMGYFRKAKEVAPSDPIARLELIRVLIGLNQLDEAEKLLGENNLPGLEPKRLLALANMRRGRFEAAAGLYREIVDEDQRDFESWGNLGVCLLAAGNAEAATESLTQSLRMRRDQQVFREKWAEAQVAAGRGEEGLKLCFAFAKEHPDDPLVRVTIARLHDLLGRPEGAIEALEEALSLDASHVPALIALAQLHERQNHIDGFAAAVDRLKALDAPVLQLPQLRAQLAFRRGDLEGALELALQIRQITNPGGQAELLGKIHDRLGNAAEAFEAFTTMNRDSALAPEIVAASAAGFRSMLNRRSRLATRQWVRKWRRSAPRDGGRDPIFLVGFPRSGTTLLDTLLMGHADLCVAEEKPMLDGVARNFGAYERLGDLDDSQLERLRQQYLAEAATHVPGFDSRLLVDKQPFAIMEALLIYRLFPDAKFLFVQRHPCDVVLSCFITRFEPIGALANFTTLEGTARLYDEMMGFWAKCRTILPLIVHRIRYERLVEDAEAETRALMAFLGLDWTDRVLDNRSTAKDRGFINTPSYAQVTEPLYDRSIGRWERYREQMKPVLQILEPWAFRMGYEI